MMFVYEGHVSLGLEQSDTRREAKIGTTDNVSAFELQ